MRVKPNSLLAVLVGLTLNLGLTATAHAALQGRDLNGSIGSFEAYYDTVLNITWLADANYAKTSGYAADGLMTWAEAITWAANLSFYNALTNQTYADWRLPTVAPVNGSDLNPNFSAIGSTDYGYNISAPGTTYAGSTASEMAHMFYNTLNNPGKYTPAGADSGCYGTRKDCLDNVGPFSNLQPWVYWSATEYGYATDHAWNFAMYLGSQSTYDKPGDFYAWAVSSGDVGISAVPEAQTYALMLAGLGLVGWRARRRG